MVLDRSGKSAHELLDHVRLRALADDHEPRLGKPTAPARRQAAREAVDVLVALERADEEQPSGCSGSGATGRSVNAERSLYAVNVTVGGSPRTSSTRPEVKAETARVASARRTAYAASRSAERGQRAAARASRRAA